MNFKFSDDFIIDSSQEPWSIEGLRVGIYGMPGSTKSYMATACLIEQFLDQQGTVVIFQPRSEYHTLKERYQVQVVGGPYLQDVPFVTLEPKLYAEAVVNDGISMVFYTGDAEDEEHLINFAERFVSHLLRLEETIKRPVMIILEEAQEYVPLQTKGHLATPWVLARMIKAFSDCYQHGRKLNVSPVVISQRPQQIHFGIRQLCNLSFYGKFSSQDIGYIDKECLKPYRDRGIRVESNQLLDLEPGRWLVIHGAEASVISVTTKRKTPHGADTPKLEYVAPATDLVQKTVSDLSKKLQEMLEKRAKEESELEKAKRTIRNLEDEVDNLKRQVGLKEDLRAIFSGEEANEVKIKEITDTYENRLNIASKRIEELEGINDEHEKTIKVLDERAKGLEKELEVYKGLRDAFDAIADRAAERKVQKALSNIPRTGFESGPVAISEVDKERIKQEIIASLPKEGMRYIPAPPREVILKSFMQEEINRLVEKVSKLPEEVGRVILFMAAKQTQTLKKELILRVWSPSYTSGSSYTKVSKIIEDAVNTELVREDSQGRLYGNIEGKIKKDLEAYNPNQEDLKVVYDHVLYLLSKMVQKQVIQ